ncbi:TonB-dependent receptor [Polaribacter sp. Z014]|uniref:SusC/RagA family TonB-linked outer membrane protein n=1 Tax=Polaribacter sp. Z014 TaxID=2927126 RepID=UPI002021401D|nr:TonB-dependent receptor [Polaribacter sp. Z014]MCL7764482.1 TonB-dependent receptor [Polaribacter sp. Z014]
MKKQKLIFLFFLLYQITVFAQQNITVKGIVKEAETGTPIIGANVIEKGTVNGVLTNFDGEFTIKVKSNSQLEFSLLGFITKLINVNGNSKINTSLEFEVSELDEVVVVGYGTQKKSDLTGSVTRAKVENFENQPNTSIVQSLQGAVTGLNVGTVTGAGGEPSISIRGRNSLSGSTSPLIVLDGVIYRGSLIDISPSDVASVDVLRDASSKAIYGSQAANGVIIVTTKTGRKAQKPTYNFSTYYAVSSPLKRLHPLDRDGYIQKASDVSWEQAYNSPDYTTPNPTFDPKTTWSGFDQIIQGYEDGTNTDWLDLVTQTPFVQNTNISMTGSTGETGYFLSAGLTEEDGWAKNDTYERINVRANFDTKVTDWLKIGMQTFVSSGDYSGAAANIRNAIIVSPLTKPYNEDGTLNYYPQGNDINPLASLEVDNFDKRLNLFGNFSATIDVPYVSGLTYKVNYSTNYRTQRAYEFNPNGLNFTGSASKSNSMTQDQTLDNVLTYIKKFNKHDLNVTLLYGSEERDGEATNAAASGFINPALGYNSLESGDIENQRVSSSAWDERSLYQMGRFKYKFNNRYLATFTVRRDGFSGFGTNKKFGTFPSVALGWVASKEKFIIDNLPWVDNLKLRGSYGSSGNRTLGRYGTLATVSGSFQYVFGDGGSPAYGQRITSLANNDLGWETTTGLNLGVDFGFANNRINGYVEYYNSRTEDLLFNINIPSITGFSSVRSNIGEISNRGLEINLNTVNIKSDNFEWNSSFVFSTNDNKVVSILGRDDDGDGKEDDLISNGIFIGESIGTIYDYVVDDKKYQIGDTNIPSGYTAGNYILKDLDGDGKITAGGDRKIIGHTEPAYRFSLYNEFKYKNFTLSAFINSVQGGKDGYLGNNTPKKSEFGWQAHTIATFNTVKELDYWTPTNPNGESSGLNYLDPIDPNLYRDRSFVRLQDVSLAYNLPKEIIEKLSITNLKLFISGKNLHTWTDWKGVDPEAGIGFQTGAYPVMRSYTVGLNLTF